VALALLLLTLAPAPGIRLPSQNSRFTMLLPLLLVLPVLLLLLLLPLPPGVAPMAASHGSTVPSILSSVVYCDCDVVDSAAPAESSQPSAMSRVTDPLASWATPATARTIRKGLKFRRVH